SPTWVDSIFGEDVPHRLTKLVSQLPWTAPPARRSACRRRLHCAYSTCPVDLEDLPWSPRQRERPRRHIRAEGHEKGRVQGPYLLGIRANSHHPRNVEDGIKLSKIRAPVSFLAIGPQPELAAVIRENRLVQHELYDRLPLIGSEPLKGGRPLY